MEYQFLLLFLFLAEANSGGVYTGCTDYEIKDGVLMFVDGDSKVIHYINLNLISSISID